MKQTERRAARAEIFEYLRRLLGPHAEVAVSQIATHLQAGNTEQGLAVLTNYDSTIGGTGLNSIKPGRKLPGVYRALTYVNDALATPNPAQFSRHIIQATCGHVEDVLKEMVRFGSLSKVFDSWPMGKLLRQGFRTRIPKTLFQDLLWLNDKINIPVKHGYGKPTGADEEEPLDSHLFALDEAVAIYLIARRLVVELESLGLKGDTEP